MNDHKSVTVAEIPDCDVCKAQWQGRKNAPIQPAYADAKLNIGPWANVCKKHFAAYGCSLGLGRGQELIVRL